MPNHFYRSHTRMRPNFTALYYANESFKFAEEYNLSGFSAQYLLELAVYDQLGGFPARVAAETSSFMDRYQTSRWFRERARGLTPSQIVQADIIEDEQFNHLTSRGVL